MAHPPYFCKIPSPSLQDFARQALDQFGHEGHPYNGLLCGILAGRRLTLHGHERLLDVLWAFHTGAPV